MLNKLIDRPIAVTMSLIMVVVLGIVSVNMLPVSLIPSVDIPYISVQVSYPSHSARELDESVMAQLRQQLLQLSGLRDIRSETKDGSGTITLSFDHGVNSDYLFVEVNEKIDRSMNSLPRDMLRPTVLKAGATDIPAFYINLSVRNDTAPAAGEGIFPVSERFSQLSSFASHVIVKRIEQLPEVAMVDLSGYVVPEILIIPDRNKLHEIDLSIGEFENAVSAVNFGMGNLTIRDGEYQYNVKVESAATGKEDIEQAYINVSGRIYRIGELATVIEHPRRRSNIVTSDGKMAVSLAVIKQSEAKMARLKKNIFRLMESFSEDYPDIEFTLTRDQTELLDYSINNLTRNIIFGVILASLIILLFMQNLRSALLIVLTMPVALICSMLFFYLFGISINIVSLSGLILGVGMMVDNSIIVIDNITYRWSNGYSLRQAVVKGTGEVFFPMLSSVLTTCAVFLPLIFLSGIAGMLFYNQALSVAITLFCSLGVTVTVIPVYYFLMFRRQDGISGNRFLQKISFDRLIPSYDRTLKFFFRRRWIMWLYFPVSVAGSILLFSQIGKDRLPEITYRDMLVNIDWNERITVEENDRRLGLLMGQIDDMTSQTTTMAGIQQFMLDHTRRMGTSEAVVYVKEQDGYTIGDIEAAVSEYLDARYPLASYGFELSGNIFDMVFGSNEAPLVARLRPTSGKAPDPNQLNGAIVSLSEHLPEVQIDMPSWQEHILYVTRPEIMSLYGVTYGELLNVLRNSLNENQLFTIIQGRFYLPVIVGDNKSGLAEIVGGATIRKNGTYLPVSIFMRQTRGQDLKYITAGPEGNFYPLELDIPERDVPGVMERIREAISHNDDFEVSFSGGYFSNRVIMWELIMVLGVAVLLLYFILAAQFESVVQPFIILSEMVIDIFGILLVLWILGLSLNIMSIIGIVVTCGIVINDSILKVDTINKLRRSGRSLKRAIMEAGQRRLKPIIMTSLTTILAITPFLARGEMGSDLQYPLSVAVITGMAVGTFVSIFFVPIFYYIIHKNR